MKSVSKKTEKEIDELLGRIKEKTGFTQEQIAGKIGYNRSYISQAKKTDSEKLYTALYNGFRDVLENITSEQNTVSEPQVAYHTNDMSRLIDANWRLAESILIDARNRENLTESNRELTKKITANDPVQNQAVVDAIRFAFLELISEVGSGKRYKSSEEVKTIYSKLVSSALNEEKKKDTQKSLDKQRI